MANWWEPGGSGGPFEGSYEKPKSSSKKSSGGGKSVGKKKKGKESKQPNQIDVLNRQYELEANYRVNEVPNALAALYGQYGGAETEERRQFNKSSEQRESEFGREFGQRQHEFNQTYGLDRDRFGLESELGRGRLSLDQNRFGLEAELGRGELELGRGRLGLETELGRGRLGLETQEQNRREREMEQQYGLEVGALTGYFNGNLTEAARARRMEEAQSLAGVMGEYRDPITGQVMGQTEARRASLEREAQSRGELSGFIESGNRAGQMTAAERAKRVQELQETWNITGEISDIDPATGRAVPNGRLTDAAQQWRTQAGLDYARTAASLSARPGDYFESAAYMRGAQATGATGFLDAINNNGFGGNMGFRSNTGGGTPQTGSMQQLAQGPGYGQPAWAQGMAPQGMPQQGMPQPGSGEMAMGAPGDMQAAVMPGRAMGDPAMGRGFAVDPANMNTAAVMSGGEAPMQVDEALPKSLQMAQQAAQGGQGAYTASMNQRMPLNVAQMQGQQGGMAAQAQMGGTPAFYNQMSGQDVAQQRLAAFQPTFQAGAHKMAPGAMEAMTPTERGLFSSAAGASGINAEDWEDQYNKSRIHTGGNPNQA